MIKNEAKSKKQQIFGNGIYYITKIIFLIQSTK